jgi:voltage-gated potassium channel
MAVEGWTLIESFYMTIITISTVGFKEVHDLTTGGRLFTGLLIMGSFGTFAYAVRAISTYVFSGEYKKYLSEYKAMNKVDKLSNHTIICGYGRVGRQAASGLSDYKNSYVVIENDKLRLENFQSTGIHYVEGDATIDDVMVKAGIERASAIITCLPSDADNLFVVLTAREMNKKIKIISRASNSTSVRKLKVAGANNVIMPDAVGGAHMASLVVTPDVMEFFDQIKIPGDDTVNLEEISFSDLDQEFKFKSIGELNAKKMTGCNIIGFKTAEDEYIINPSYDTVVAPNTKLFVLGNTEQIALLNKRLGIELS